MAGWRHIRALTVGMARCAVPARDSGRNEPEEAYVGRDSFRRLTLRFRRRYEALARRDGDGDGAARHPYPGGCNGCAQ